MGAWLGGTPRSGPRVRPHGHSRGWAGSSGLPVLADAELAVGLDVLPRPVAGTIHQAGALPGPHTLPLTAQHLSFGAPAAYERPGVRHPCRELSSGHAHHAQSLEAPHLGCCRAGEQGTPSDQKCHHRSEGRGHRARILASQSRWQWGSHPEGRALRKTRTRGQGG